MPRSDPQPRPASGTCDTPGGCQRWNFDAMPPQRDLDAYYLAPFRAAVGVGVRSLMCAYSGLNGKPSCGSPELLTDVLRTMWGSDAHVVSDCTAIELMQDTKWDSCKPPYPPTTCVPESFDSHNFTHTVAETANAALSSGCDVDCGPFNRMWLAGLVANSSVPQASVDKAVSRLYATAFRLGLLDPGIPQPYTTVPPWTVDSQQHRDLALSAARSSVVLLKNADNALPLAAGIRVAFIGPHANATRAFLSNYAGDNTLVDSHSPLLVARRRGIDVTYARGCNICDSTPNGFPNMPCTNASDTSGFAEAASVAGAADVAVVFVGSDQTTEAGK